jgi:trimethylamine--corrinoid protein Co-methyltransferase
MRYSRFFSDEGLSAIHDASLSVLERTGLKVNEEGARGWLKRAGCTVDESDNRVRFPSKVVEEALRTVPPSYRFYGRDPSKDVELPRDRPAIATASSAPFINDPLTGEHRYSTARDIAAIARLIDALPGYDIFSVSVLASDAPSGKGSLARFFPALKNCSKPVRSNTPSMRELLEILELGEAIAGGAEAYREQPFINHHYCPVISPLTMDVESTRALVYLVERGLPVYGSIVPNAGMTSPMSLLGTLAQGNAEFLALTTLVQSIRPGAPVLYAVLSTVADMRTGSYAPGGVETAMLQMGHSEMARRYGVPSGGYIGLSGSHANDAQSGYETGIGATAAALAGTDLFNMGGLLGSLMTFDFAKAVIDGEIGMMLKRLASGFPFGAAVGEAARTAHGLEEDFCVGLIDEVGPGGSFMELEHTVATMREAALYPHLATRAPFSQWEAAGKPLSAEVALREALSILRAETGALMDTAAEARARARFPDLVPGEVVL